MLIYELSPSKKIILYVARSVKREYTIAKTLYQLFEMLDIITDTSLQNSLHGLFNEY